MKWKFTLSYDLTCRETSGYYSILASINVIQKKEENNQFAELFQII